MIVIAKYHDPIMKRGSSYDMHGRLSTPWEIHGQEFFILALKDYQGFYGGKPEETVLVVRDATERERSLYGSTVLHLYREGEDKSFRSVVEIEASDAMMRKDSRFFAEATLMLIERHPEYFKDLKERC